jgi:hypothetical protein
LNRKTIAAPGHVYGVAALVGRTPRDVAQRIAELGFADLDPTLYPDEAEQYLRERKILGERAAHSYLMPNEPVLPNFVSQIASALHMSTTAVLEILKSHGLSSLPTVDEVLRSQNLDGAAPWLPTTAHISLGRAIKAAGVLNTTMTDILRQLSELGYTSTEGRPDWFTDYSAKRLYQACSDMDELDIGDVVEASRIFDVSLVEAEQRLNRLGLHTVPFPRSLSDEDVRILSVDLDDQYPWLKRKYPVPPSHVLRILWQFGLEQDKTTDRLKGLGYPIKACEPQPRDVMLVGESSEIGRYSESPTTLSELIAVGRRSSMPVVEVAKRLRELGVDVSDVADLIRRALAGVPRPADN